MTQQNLRIVVFSPSIISEVGNPQAVMVREICQAFADLGCDVTHLEERGNSWNREMLLSQGSEPVRAFNRDFPQIRYRQYEIPQGIHRSVWFGRELATADLVVVYPGSPDGVVEEAEGFAVRQVVRIWDSAASDLAELRELMFGEGDEDADQVARFVIAAVHAEMIRRRT